MSRSYKKAVYKGGYDSKRKPFAKRQAAKAVRRYKGPIPDGSGYKLLYNSWNICDFVSDCRFEPWPGRLSDVHMFLGDDGQYHIYK